MSTKGNEFLSKMEIIHSKLNPIWESGRYKNIIPNSGRHWSLPGHIRPVSISIMEGYILFNIAYVIDAINSIEIGTAFGYSSCWIAGGMMHNNIDNNWLATIDCLSEGTLGNKGILFAKKAIKELDFEHIVDFYQSKSPDALPNIIEERKICMAFIDGDHKNNQPLKDYLGILPHLKGSGVIVWHDVHDSYDTPMAIRQAEKDGFSTIELNTSCKMCISYRRDDIKPLLLSAYSASKEFLLLPKTKNNYWLKAQIK